MCACMYVCNGQTIIMLISYHVMSYFNMGSYFKHNVIVQPCFVSRALFLPRSSRGQQQHKNDLVAATKVGRGGGGGGGRVR